jgi:predicted transcriptional regulator
MSQRQIKRVNSPLSPEKIAELRRVRDLVDGEKEEILAMARRYKAEQDALLADAGQVLKEVREASGLSLSEMEARTGMHRSALSRLENGVEKNPTINTLNRYAAGLGKRLVIALRDKGKT